MQKPRTVKTVTVPQETVEVTSHTPYHSLCLNRDGDESVVPRNHDIVILTVIDAPELLESISLVIGGAEMYTIERDEFINGQNILPKGGLPMSLSYYHYTNLHFNYNKEYIEENEESIMEDEYTEEVVYGDIEEEFFDGDEHYFGRRVVSRNMVPTGRKVKRIIKEAEVVMPEVCVVVIPSQFVGGEQSKSVPFWETIMVDPNRPNEKEYINRLVSKYKFHIKDNMSVEAAIQEGKPFYGRVENIIRYSNGMAAKAFVF